MIHIKVVCGVRVFDRPLREAFLLFAEDNSGGPIRAEFFASSLETLEFFCVRPRLLSPFLISPTDMSSHG